jgi:GT2 family glycosyltransferase
MGTAPVPEMLPRIGVTAVIPAYNYARYLAQAIDSVLEQDYSPFEVVVVDDGSTDNTADVVAQYGQQVRYIHQTNAGLSAARNTGIYAAQHNYVAFLDADDQWLPEFLKRAMGTFVRLPPEFVLVACSIQYIDSSGKKIDVKQLRPPRDEEITLRDILFKTRFAPSGVVAKRAVFDRCGHFDTTLRSSEDRDMWLRVAACGRILQLRDRLTLVRRHPGSMSTHADRMKANTGRVIKKAYQNRLAPHRCICLWLRVLAFFHFQTAWMYFEEGRLATAVRAMVLSLALYPWFLRPREFNEPALFRLRALLRFACKSRACLAARDGKVKDFAV